MLDHMMQRTPNPLIEAIKENNFTRVEALIASECPFEKSTFNSEFYFQLYFNNEFDIKIEPAIFELLNEKGYFSVDTKLLYFAKSNAFEALSDLLKNLESHTSALESHIFDKEYSDLLKYGILKKGLELAIENSGYEVVKKLLSTIGRMDDVYLWYPSQLIKLAKRKNTEMLENEGPRIANLLLPSSLLEVHGIFLWRIEHVDALREALLTGKLWLLEMFINFPGFCLFSRFKERTQQSPLAYLLSQTTKDESILLFLIEHALDKDRFEVRFDKQKNESIFFEKTDDYRIEHVWGPDELKTLFKVAIHFPKQTDALLTRFPTIFKPIVETMLKEDGAFISFHTRNIGNCEYRTLLGEILEAHGILKPLNNTISYRQNKRDWDDKGSDEKHKKHKKHEKDHKKISFS